jgi:hypothetical protein
MLVRHHMHSYSADFPTQKKTLLANGIGSEEGKDGKLAEGK